MKPYYDRVITYDPDTQNYRVSVPELGIEVLADTESSGLISIREEVEAAAKNVRIGPQDNAIPISGDAFTVTLPGSISASNTGGSAHDSGWEPGAINWSRAPAIPRCQKGFVHYFRYSTTGKYCVYCGVRP